MNVTLRERSEPLYVMGSLSPVVKAFLAGSFSGTCSTVLFQPLDLIKTRIQKQSGGSRLSMVGAVREVVVCERVRGLWRGVVPSLVRTVPGVGLYFSTMHTLRTHLCRASGSPAPTPSQSLAIGALARTVSCLLTIPITVVKIRRESGMYSYSGTTDALVSILRKEGGRGLTSGLVATLTRDVPFSALYLMFYERLKQLLTAKNLRHPSKRNRTNNDLASALNLPPSAVNFTSGVAAGVLASLVTQPADVVKTRQQLTTGGCKQSLTAISLGIARQEGLVGFFVGSVPRMMRRTMMAALAWTVYEKALRNFGLK